MSIQYLLMLAVGDAMDAFAVSMAKGTVTRNPRPQHYLSVALWFGGFQALMTLLGYFVGARFAPLVERYDHWISFALLSILGIMMIWEAFGVEKPENVKPDFSVKTMLPLALATSIDAMAVGVSLAFQGADIWLATLLVGLVTMLFSAVGLKVGSLFGNHYKIVAELVGGLILLFIGIDILVTHLSA